MAERLRVTREQRQSAPPADTWATKGVFTSWLRGGPESGGEMLAKSLAGNSGLVAQAKAVIFSEIAKHQDHTRRTVSCSRAC